MNLSSTVVTIDTRENDRKRTQHIETILSSLGAFVEHKRCRYVDYVVRGIVRGAAVDIGVEYKTFQDFVYNRDELRDRFFHALQEYTNVALFVEFMDIKYECRSDDTIISHWNCGHITYTNLSIFENILASYTKWGIEVRLLSFGYVQAPYSILNLIRHTTKECHSGIKVKYNKPDSVFKNMLVQIDGVGPKTAVKIVDRYKTMENLVLADLGDLTKTIGTKTGKHLYDVLRKK